MTQTAMEPGYGSPSAFTYAFRTDTGCSPLAFLRRQAKQGHPAHPASSDTA